MRQVPEHIFQKQQRLRTLPDDAWLGTDVADARKLMGMSQERLARRIGYNRGSVARIETGDKVEIVVVLALRHLLSESENEGESGELTTEDAP